MDQLQFGPEAAKALWSKVDQVRMAGAELSSFSEKEPFLAAQCGVELAALEARAILSNGAADRILGLATQGAQQRRPFAVFEQDMRAMGRLEGVVSLASNRIAQRYMAMESEGSNSAKLGSVISLVSGAVGLIKTFF